MKTILILAIFSILTLFTIPEAEAYIQKSPYQDYGKPSKVNGLPRIKAISGYTKHTSKGYVRVNPYTRSKS